MKQYQLCIENIGGDVYTLMSKGHHDIHEFMRAVRETYQWPLGVPEHIWMRAVPSHDPSYRCLYREAEKGARGAWPATYVSEAYSCNGDTYEQKFPQG